MTQRIIVAYATRAGSTVEVSGVIGEVLSARGYAVDVKPIRDRPQVQGYDAAVLGSAIRMGQWLPEAVSFVQKNQEALSKRPVALFTVHMHNLGQDADSRANRLAYLDAVRALVKPVDEVYFAGKIDLGRLNLLERIITRAVGGSNPEADLRDWEAIRGWARTVAV